MQINYYYYYYYYYLVTYLLSYLIYSFTYLLACTYNQRQLHGTAEAQNIRYRPTLHDIGR